MVKRTSKNLNTRTSASAQADAYQGQAGENAAPRRSGGAARVIAVPLSQVRPDPAQARVVLPPDLYQDFHFPAEGRGKLDCYQVAGILLESSAHDAGMQRQVNGLVELGDSIVAHGQIEPATGYRLITAGGDEVIRLLVGERRFWALALLAVRLELTAEPTLDLLLKDGYNLGEQLAENLQRDDLSAVDLAKGIAALLLAELGQEPNAPRPDYLDYLRQVLTIRKLPAGSWEAVQRQIPRSRQHLSRILNILRLPDELLYLASIHKLPEKTLRAVLEADPPRWDDLIRAALIENFTAAEVAEAVSYERAPVKTQKTHSGVLTVHQKAASRVLSLVKLTHQNEFGHNYLEVAGLISAGLADSADVTRVGERLMALGEAVLQTAERRHR